jgi:DNA-directed RNA polymerase specialized sigma24 family protein
MINKAISERDLYEQRQNPKFATCTFEQFRWDNNADKPFTAMGGAKLRCLNLYRTTDTPRPVCPEKQDTKVLSLDELALIRSEPISMQWTDELRKNVGLYPSCKLLKELLSLDVYTRTVIYPLLIKGWSSSRIADRLKISIITTQKLLEIGREELKRKLAPPR